MRGIARKARMSVSALWLAVCFGGIYYFMAEPQNWQWLWGAAFVVAVGVGLDLRRERCCATLAAVIFWALVPLFLRETGVNTMGLLVLAITASFVAPLADRYWIRPLIREWEAEQPRGQRPTRFQPFGPDPD